MDGATEEKEGFYQKVKEIYDSCPSNDIKIVPGDCNAKWEEKKSTKE